MSDRRKDPGKYHSALSSKELIEGAPLVQRVEIPGFGVAFAHDVRNGVPPDYLLSVDVLYADLPWPAGFALFEARANSAGGTYMEFIGAVAEWVRVLGKPAVLTTSKAAVKWMPKPDSTVTVRLNSADALALCYGVDVPAQVDTVDVLQMLASQFKCVGDFCCGYGRSGRVFAGRGGKFVMSDYNPQCIGVIAAQWGAR